SEDAVRLRIWQTIPSVVGKNWLFGLGIGDVRETLAKAYQEKNMDFALNKRLNAHNQYLETYVGLGLIGLSCLLLILGSALWQSIRRRDMVFFLFMLIILINFMFESVLERFFGVLFFVFFLSIFSMREVDSV
ncbi:MAG TPA: O-antigen ligase family protein, partial [Tenuifilaceae bacterium]|nr:O-antigen ligase family protein [Tenuifilaceae bacterium]